MSETLQKVIKAIKLPKDRKEAETITEESISNKESDKDDSSTAGRALEDLEQQPRKKRKWEDMFPELRKYQPLFKYTASDYVSTAISSDSGPSLPDGQYRDYSDRCLRSELEYNVIPTDEVLKMIPDAFRPSFTHPQTTRIVESLAFHARRGDEAIKRLDDLIDRANADSKHDVDLIDKLRYSLEKARLGPDWVKYNREKEILDERMEILDKWEMEQTSVAESTGRNKEKRDKRLAFCAKLAVGE